MATAYLPSDLLAGLQPIMGDPLGDELQRRQIAAANLEEEEKRDKIKADRLKAAQLLEFLQGTEAQGTPLGAQEPTPIPKAPPLGSQAPQPAPMRPGAAPGQAPSLVDSLMSRMAPPGLQAGAGFQAPPAPPPAPEVRPGLSREGMLQLALRTGQVSPEKFFELTQPADAAKIGGMPASLQEWKAYQAMSPADQARYLEMKRAQKVIDLGGEMVTLAPGGERGKTYAKTVPPEQQPGFKGAQAAAIAAEKQRVQEGGEKAAREREKAKRAHDAFKMKRASEVESLNEFEALAGNLAASPYLAGVTGVGRLAAFVPGSPWADVDVDIDRLTSMGAIEIMAKLKRESPTGASGFGALSAPELKVIQDSFGALKSKKQSPGKMRSELMRIVGVMQKYRARIEAFETSVEGEPGTTAPEEGGITDQDIDNMTPEQLREFLEAP